MLKFGASVPTSSMVVGYPQREWSWMSAILKDPETNEFNIFDTDVWTHMCIAYDKETEFLRMFKVVGILQRRNSSNISCNNNSNSSSSSSSCNSSSNYNSCCCSRSRINNRTKRTNDYLF